MPAEVDPSTGYRVYAPDQLLDAAVLRRLRALDVPLRKIALNDPEGNEFCVS